MSFIEKVQRRANASQSLVCIGLDSDLSRLPADAQKDPHPQFAFNRAIIAATHEVALAYKLNVAFYEMRGGAGWHDMALTVAYLREHYPDIPVVCDAKRGDIESTNEAYAYAIFDELGFDAVTLHPYTGGTALTPFLKRADKGCIILCRTSNPGAGELQDLMVEGEPLWRYIARKVATEWNRAGNCAVVMGATAPEQLAETRAVIGDMPILVPGVGAQGGDVVASIQAGMRADKGGLLVNASRSILFARDPAQAARDLYSIINRARGV